MLTIYETEAGGLKARPDAATSDKAVWIDLISPTRDEEQQVERITGVAIPTREEMAEIEVSSRLYTELGSHFMTANIIYAVETPEPLAATVTFVLTNQHLITIRYAETRAFNLFLTRARKGDAACHAPTAVMVGLLEAIIDREADLIERLQADTEKLARTIFSPPGRSPARSQSLEEIIRQIGRVGEISSRTRESLLSLGRVVTYMAQICGERHDAKIIRQRLKTEARDIQSLTDHVQYLGQRINFMLDASLGMVSIEQNQIIKLFSVAAVMLMPPTLIASIYGMNFKHMPELEWVFGYPFALGLMVLSALLFYFYFRRKRWL
ncbi:MAG: magnesium transporter CorA family protein [Hyphomicrobiaceae bacterium]